MDPMKKALAARKGQGIDITILLGQPKEEKSSDKTDLAPPPEKHAENPDDEMKDSIMGLYDEPEQGQPMSLGQQVRMAMAKGSKHVK